MDDTRQQQGKPSLFLCQSSLRENMTATCNVFPVTRNDTTIPSFPLGAVFDQAGSEISRFQRAKTR